MSIFFSFLQHETRVLQSTVYERRDHGNDMMVQILREMEDEKQTYNNFPPSMLLKTTEMLSKC